ncbi:MAG: hypothetical protein WCD70_14775 [Alphaproteobacteria bacterium]
MPHPLIAAEPLTQIDARLAEIETVINFMAAGRVVCRQRREDGRLFVQPIDDPHKYLFQICIVPSNRPEAHSKGNPPESLFMWTTSPKNGEFGGNKIVLASEGLLSPETREAVYHKLDRLLNPRLMGRPVKPRTFQLHYLY